MDYTYFFRQGSITRSVASVTLMAMLLWLTGLPMLLSNVGAAQLLSVSDTISDSDLGVAANHEITFTLPNGLPDGGTIDVDMPTGFTIGSVVSTDIDIASSTVDFTVGAACGATNMSAGFGGQTLVITNCAGEGALASNTPLVIQIGTNAAGGVNQITNNTSAGSYEITMTTYTDGAQTTAIDSGVTRIVIIDDVLVTAAVNSRFQFTISGVASAQGVNGTSTTGVTTATTIPFGTLDPNVVYTMAQDLTVDTNAAEGFVVTVFTDGNLRSATAADIDNFIDSDGNGSSTPATWQSPEEILNVERTYGHMGITSDDTDYFPVSNTWAGDIKQVPRAVYAHTGPTDGTTTGEGTTRVGYQIEITNLQEAAQDYSNTLTYIATPTF